MPEKVLKHVDIFVHSSLDFADGLDIEVEVDWCIEDHVSHAVLHVSVHSVTCSVYLVVAEERLHSGEDLQSSDNYHAGHECCLLLQFALVSPKILSVVPSEVEDIIDHTR